MSTQDVIADQIEGEVIGSGWDVSATRDQANAMARRAVKALETLGYAVVELPSPGDERDDLRAAIDRVRMLHSKRPVSPGCTTCNEPWPCSTIRTLNGEAQS